MWVWNLVLALLWMMPLDIFPQESNKPRKNKKPKVKRTKWDDMDIGTFQAYGLEVPEGKDIWRPALKGLNIRVGPNLEATVCYDTERMRLAAGWAGGFLKLPTGRDGLQGVPQPVGEILYRTRMAPGWAGPKDEWQSPRPPAIKGKDVYSFGPLPREWAKWRGHYRAGQRVVLSYTVGSTEVLEMPEYDPAVGGIFIRWFDVGKADQEQVQHMLVAEELGGNGEEHEGGFSARLEKDGIVTSASVLMRQNIHDPHHSLHVKDGRILYRLGESMDRHIFGIAVWRGPRDKFLTYQKYLEKLGTLEPPVLAKLTLGGRAMWGEPVLTKGRHGLETGPYVVDAITVPEQNPWKSWIRCSGFDFFKDGTTAAVCSVTGDVWVVGGIDESLKELKWKRFATGLFQPLGLKIVDGKVYVLGRDQITRLHDLNDDGEADYYENFNNDISITNHYHEFCLNLETDAAGNFYFIKGGNLRMATVPHHGCLVKVSADGSKLEEIANGHRAPNGMSVGPNDEITSADNEGNWVPASRVNLVKRGGFYGHVYTAHQAKQPTDYDKPLLWLPHQVDNSSGGQIWVTSDRWGQSKGDLLHLSYGRCRMFKIMREEIDGQPQGGAVQFPLRFDSGIMRGRFNPKDGQLYAVGLKVWQTSGARYGAFHRVRYTGKPVNMPADLHIKKGGLEITFTDPLDAASAVDDQNYAIDQWNYRWTQNYGSKLYSTRDPNKVLGEKKQAVFKGDTIEIQSIKLSEDKKTVTLKVAGLKPVMQSRIRYNIKADDGTVLKQDIFHTINRVPSQ
jgi:hypothetical protein